MLKERKNPIENWPTRKSNLAGRAAGYGGRSMSDVISDVESIVAEVGDKPNSFCENFCHVFISIISSCIMKLGNKTTQK